MGLLLIVLAAVAGFLLLLVVVWLLVMAYVKSPSPGRGIDRFFEAGDGELPPEELVKHVGGFRHGSCGA